MKVSSLKFFNSILLGLLSLLGFSTSCDDLAPRAEYGCPSADYLIKGTVTDAETKQPVKDIKVVMSTYQPDYHFAVDSVQTDATGKYFVKSNAFPLNDLQFRLQLRDIDGDENGKYADLDTLITFSNPDYKNESGWYRGETEQEVNLELPAKQ